VRSIQILGAIFTVVGVVMLYLLRGPLISLILAVLEFFAIVIALVLVVVGVAMMVGGRLILRRFWMRT
jgi:hypothetical protein